MSPTVPRVSDGVTSVWAQYTIRLPPRDGARRSPKTLKAQGIPTAIHYPKPVHRQEAYRAYPGRRRRRAGQRAAGRRR